VALAGVKRSTVKERPVNRPFGTLLLNALPGSGRKLHIGLDPDSGDIVTPLLTPDQVGDETALPGLIAGTDVKVYRFLASL